MSQTFLPFAPRPPVMWRVYCATLVPGHEPVRQWAAEYPASTAQEALHRVALQANHEGLPHEPYLWIVEPRPMMGHDVAVRVPRRAEEDDMMGWEDQGADPRRDDPPWHPRPGTRYDW